MGICRRTCVERTEPQLSYLLALQRGSGYNGAYNLRNFTGGQGARELRVTDLSDVVCGPVLEELPEEAKKRTTKLLAAFQSVISLHATER